MCLPHWCTPSDYLWMLDSFPQPAENKKTKECRKMTVMQINKSFWSAYKNYKLNHGAQRAKDTLLKTKYFCETFKETLKVDF